eukprot:35179-Amphidinium_carterae.3
MFYISSLPESRRNNFDIYTSPITPGGETGWGPQGQDHHQGGGQCLGAEKVIYWSVRVERGKTKYPIHTDRQILCLLASFPHHTPLPGGETEWGPQEQDHHQGGCQRARKNK